MTTEIVWRWCLVCCDARAAFVRGSNASQSAVSAASFRERLKLAVKPSSSGAIDPGLMPWRSTVSFLTGRVSTTMPKSPRQGQGRSSADPMAFGLFGEMSVAGVIGRPPPPVASAARCDQGPVTAATNGATRRKLRCRSGKAQASQRMSGRNDASTAGASPLGRWHQRVHLEDRFGDVETDCRDRLQDLAPSNRGCLRSTRIHGTRVPAEEPSTS